MIATVLTLDCKHSGTKVLFSFCMCTVLSDGQGPHAVPELLCAMILQISNNLLKYKSSFLCFPWLGLRLLGAAFSSTLKV